MKSSRFRVLIISIVLIILAAAIPARAQTPTATPASNITVPQYGLFETQFDVNSSVKNPYDPAQIDVMAQFTAPGGTQSSVPAFYMQPITQNCNQNCSVELFQPNGNPGWRVRFTPTQVGAYSYTITARDSVSSRVVASGNFTVTASQATGFIRVGSNHHYFGYDNGTPYFPIGPNLGWSWSGANGTNGYLDWLKKLHSVGANYARLYVDVPWFIGLDWRTPVGDYTAAQGDAWRLDTILQTAQEQGIALQIVLVWNQGFTTYAGLPVNAPTTPARPNINADWSDNPYNVKNGGLFANAAQFFSTDAGRNSMHRLLRYIVARWGYSPTIFAWEMIDQLDHVSTADPTAASDWLKDEIGYLRKIDPYAHPITAGVHDMNRESLLDSAVLDFRETRFYQRRPIEPGIDQVLGTLGTLGPEVDSADRPVLMTEFSLNPWFEPAADDPTGVHLQQTMWAAALSGSAGGASSWWWDTYLFPQNLIAMYRPLSAFTQGIPWNTANLRPVEAVLASDTPLGYQPIHVAGYAGAYLAAKAPDITFRLTPDGISPPISETSSYLYGVTYSSQLSQPQRYLITPPIDTTLTVNVRRVSEKAAAKLVIIIDGKTAAAMTLSPSSQPASLSVPITAGEHNVVLDNLGDDYLQLDSLDVAAYIAPLRTVALADPKAGIFLALAQNRDYTWQNAAKNIEAKPLMVNLSTGDMPPGLYRVELWDTFSGNVVGQEDQTIPMPGPGKLKISLLPISRMLAVRVVRVAEPGGIPTATAIPSETPRPVLPTPTNKP